jgi:hypothetical protein
MEMLHGALLEPLPFRNAMRLRAPLDDRARNSALRELDGHRHADRAAADDHDLLLLLHGLMRVTQDLIRICRRWYRGPDAGFPDEVLPAITVFQ